TLSFTGLSDSGSADSPTPITTDGTFTLNLAGDTDANGVSVAYQVSTDGGTTWTATSATQTSLPDASYLFHAVVTDPAGNSSTSNAISVIVDNTAPSETISSTIATNTGLTTTISSGGLTKDNTLGLSGTVSDTNGVSSVHIFD